jgi:hypothetical protein
VANGDVDEEADEEGIHGCKKIQNQNIRINNNNAIVVAG